MVSLPRSLRSIRSILRIGSLLFGFLAASCSPAPTASETLPLQSLSAEERRLLLGDDRVADALLQPGSQVPKTFAEFEKLLGVGRACPRTDSKEIYVLREPSTRIGGEQKALDKLVPRAVVTGCGVGATGTEKENAKASLMVALISAPEAKGYGTGDTMVLNQVEVMALDRTTGLYNFYVLSPLDAPGAVQRLNALADGTVSEVTKRPNAPLVSRNAGKRCFHCHVHGDPIMNEFSGPWLHWVSSEHPEPVTEGLSGETLAIVSEARAPANEHTRTSFAGPLEETLRISLGILAGGARSEDDMAVKKGGLVAATLEGALPGGIRALLRSSFCETVLAYGSSSGPYPPVQVYMEPAVFDGESYPRATEETKAPAITQFPIRSHLDRRIEDTLVDRGFLTRPMALALRLLDDENDVFSTKRCSTLDQVQLPAVPAPDGVQKAIREALLLKAPSLPPATAAFVTALLKPETSAEALAQARTNYLEDARKRMASYLADAASEASRARLAERSLQRRAAVAKLYEGVKNPMPVFPTTVP